MKYYIPYQDMDKGGGLYILGKVLSLPDKVMRADEKLVYSQLAYHAGNDGECFPSVDGIAKRLGFLRSRVFRILTRLEEKGFVQRQGNVGHSNNYLFPEQEIFNPSEDLGQVNPSENLGRVLVREPGTGTRPRTSDTKTKEKKKEKTSLDPSEDLGRVEKSLEEGAPLPEPEPVDSLTCSDGVNGSASGTGTCSDGVNGYLFRRGEHESINKIKEKKMSLDNQVKDILRSAPLSDSVPENPGEGSKARVERQQQEKNLLDIESRGGTEPQENPVTAAQIMKINMLSFNLGLDNQVNQSVSEWLSRYIGRTVESINDLTESEASSLIEAIQDELEASPWEP